MTFADPIIAFWFGLEPRQWWKRDPALDADIRARFLALWEEQRPFPAGAFLGEARNALAAVILFDQFPRNMLRGQADQFATDPLALAIAGGAVDAGLDAALPPRERGFLYMPFEHSERRDDQRRSLLLFTALGDPDLLDYARRHHDIVERFGRFPHRNVILGRESTPQEVAAGCPEPF